MRTPPLPADYLCQGLQTNLRKTLDTTSHPVEYHKDLCTVYNLYLSLIKYIFGNYTFVKQRLVDLEHDLLL